MAIFNPTSPFGDIPGSIYLGPNEPFICIALFTIQIVAKTLRGSVGRSACQALVQCGLLLRLLGHDEEARVDFEKAAALGSEFVWQQAVILNPSTSLCNRMLSEVINKLRNPEMSDML
uniref:Tetratricopeptide repeat domain 36 n=1 Tax=Cyprinus carpio TaxID=7962 RepID=A0A8C2F0E4_CYPCA